MNDLHQRSELTSQTITYYNAFIVTKNHLRFIIFSPYCVHTFSKRLKVSCTRLSN